MLFRDLEHALELGPIRNVCLLEDCARTPALMRVNDFLRFGAECEVCKDNVAGFGEEESGEGEVYACSRARYDCGLAVDGG